MTNADFAFCFLPQLIKKIIYCFLCHLLFFCFASFSSQAELAGIVQFPANFKWCVATAAHQIEGNNINSDHYHWEIGNQNRVISMKVVENRQAKDILKRSSGAFAREPIQCPVIPLSQDPDSARRHTQLFPQNQNQLNESSPQTYICEYSGQAVDHWNRVSEDIELIKKLNVQWYRMSIEWAKIEPQRSVFDHSAIQHYIMELKALIAAGIEPHVTLFHFTMPQWLRQEGGWENIASPIFFREFVEKVYQEFSNAGLFIPVWYTFNEPMVHLSAGYLAGVLPPGEISPLKVKTVLMNILLAHMFAYQDIHQLARDEEYRRHTHVRVGMAHHLRVFQPLDNLENPERNLTQHISEYIDYAWNWMLIDALETGSLTLRSRSGLGESLPQVFSNFEIEYANHELRGTQDFLGINYYSRDRITLHPKIPDMFEFIVDPAARKSGRITDMNWEIYPQGLFQVVKSAYERVHQVSGRNLPIIISENGIADSDDDQRIQFIKDHLVNLKRAIDAGIPVEGYCYWSLMDNFEWNSGYYPQFGLYDVDLQHDLKRTPRPSAEFFSSLAKTNQFSPK